MDALHENKGKEIISYCRFQRPCHVTPKELSHVGEYMRVMPVCVVNKLAEARLFIL